MNNTYSVFWSNEDQEFVALCAEFPSLSWLASTPDEALCSLKQLIDKIEKDIQAA